MLLSRVLLLMAGVMHRANSDVGAGRGQTQRMSASQYPSEQTVEIQRYGPTQISDQPWGFGAVTSRPSFETSLRAISRSRPIARKMRRRLIALAGATDRSNTVRKGIILKATTQERKGGG